MEKVTCLIGGAARGGTTTLFKYFSSHPQISYAKRKELHYFNQENALENYRLKFAGISEEEYHRKFTPWIWSTKHRIESTPMYMYVEDVPKRVFGYNPKMKWILLLRNPVIRAYSNWAFHHKFKGHDLSFSQSIKNELDGTELRQIKHYIGKGKYAEQIKRIQKHFPKEQILLIKSERFFEDPKPELERVCHFLDIKPFVSPILHMNQSRADYSVMNKKENDLLQEVYKDEITKVEELTGWDCSDWRHLF